jgi:hypothetical protein
MDELKRLFCRELRKWNQDVLIRLREDVIFELKDIGEGVGNLAFKLSLVEVGGDRMTP